MRTALLTIAFCLVCSGCGGEGRSESLEASLPADEHPLAEGEADEASDTRILHAFLGADSPHSLGLHEGGRYTSVWIKPDPTGYGCQIESLGRSRGTWTVNENQVRFEAESEDGLLVGRFDGATAVFDPQRAEHVFEDGHVLERYGGSAR